MFKCKLMAKMIVDFLKCIIIFVVAILVILFSITAKVLRMFWPLSYRKKNIQGSIVVITGGASGIGKLVAIQLSKLGCIVVSWDVNEKNNEELVACIKNNGNVAYAHTVNISDYDQVIKAAEKVKNEVGPISILINNAGIVSGKLFEDLSKEEIEQTININCLGYMWTCKAFLPVMIEQQKGHIVNVSSMAGWFGVSQLSDYCASKFAVVGFHEALTSELSLTGHKISTTLVCPYFINTGMFEGVYSSWITVLDANYVANYIISGILYEHPIIVLPHICLGFLVLKRIHLYAVLKS